MNSFALSPFLPVLFLAAGALLAHSCAPLQRREGALLAMAAVLLGLLASILSQRPQDMPPAFAMAGALLLALPLLDRARARCLPVAAALGSAVVYYLLHHMQAAFPQAPQGALVPAFVAALSIAAMAGGAFLGPHKARFTKRGDARLVETEPAYLFAGYALLAAAFALLSADVRDTPIFPQWWTAPCAAALTVALFARRREDVLAKLGEALLAAIVLKSAIGLTLDEAVVVGVLAALCVLKGEALALALRLDDPAHVIGALLLPSLFGLLLPGVLELARIGDVLQWLGVAVALGLALAATLWPLAMLTLGFELPPRTDD